MGQFVYARQVRVQHRLDQLARLSPLNTAKLGFQTRSVTGLAGHGFRLVNRGQMEVGPNLRLGTSVYGFTDVRDKGLIRNQGHLVLGRDVVVATGNRWDIARGATMTVGDHTYFSPFGCVVVSTALTIGKRCAVAWDVQILDDDFHAYHPAVGVTANKALPIVVGDHVWIGSRASIFKGVAIADDCIIAGGSVVTRSVHESGCLIAGSPARVVRRGVSWE